MKNKKKFLTFLAMVLLTISSGNSVRAQKKSISELKEVDIYFLFIGSEGTESKILPLRREVSRKAPLFPAIKS